MNPATARTSHKVLLGRIAVLLLLVAVILAYLGRGDWLHQVLSMGLGVWVGIPVSLGALIAFKVGARFVVLGCALVLLAGLLQIGLGYALLKWDIASAKLECEALVQTLDRIHADTGQFPLPGRLKEALAEFGLSYPQSRLLHYYSDATSFTCEVSNPEELFAGFTFTDVQRQWVEWRD